MGETNQSVANERQPDQPVAGNESGQANVDIECAARRRFAKVGLVSPLIVTLASRPAWGMNSGHLSGNLSSAPNNQLLGDLNGLGLDNSGINSLYPSNPYGLYPNDGPNSF